MLFGTASKGVNFQYNEFHLLSIGVAFSAISTQQWSLRLRIVIERRILYRFFKIIISWELNNIRFSTYPIYFFFFFVGNIRILINHLSWKWRCNKKNVTAHLVTMVLSDAIFIIALALLLFATEKKSYININSKYNEYNINAKTWLQVGALESLTFPVVHWTIVEMFHISIIFFLWFISGGYILIALVLLLFATEINISYHYFWKWSNRISYRNTSKPHVVTGHTQCFVGFSWFTTRLTFETKFSFHLQFYVFSHVKISTENKI